ncbi:MAG: hypothetical protein AAFY42_08190 [Pseudomonadota bacterium]
MRVLFYLPVVTPWWFEQIILPLAEKLVADSEVHILAPIRWKGTGVSQHEYDLCAHMPQIAWHIVNDKDHPSMRTGAVQREQIVEFVESLDPDLVLCRSADLETVARFPGIVRHIVEGGADPLLLPIGVIHFAKAPFDHGILPPLEDAHIAKLHALMEPYWEPLVNAPEAQLSAQSAFREWAALPDTAPTLFLPLEYEHEENFYTAQRVARTPNVGLVEDVLEQINGRALLALTNHPLNDLYVDNSALLQLAEAHAEQLSLLPGETPSGARSTALMMRTADGVLLGDSKCYSLAGFCGTPIMRFSRFRTGDWLNASDDLESFVSAVAHGKAATPDRETARTWFAYHAANSLVHPKDPELSGAEIIDRLINPFDPERWDRNISVFAVGWDEKERLSA